MSKTVFRLEGHGPAIVAIEVERETDKSIWVFAHGRLQRHDKSGWRGVIFGSWDAAHEEMVRRAAQALLNAEISLARALQGLEKAKAYKATQEAA